MKSRKGCVIAAVVGIFLALLLAAIGVGVGVYASRQAQSRNLALETAQRQRAIELAPLLARDFHEKRLTKLGPSKLQTAELRGYTKNGGTYTLQVAVVWKGTLNLNPEWMLVDGVITEQGVVISTEVQDMAPETFKYLQDTGLLSSFVDPARMRE